MSCPTTFEEYKKEMKDHYKEEIIDQNELVKESSAFYIDNILDYSTNCLFLELLDFRIHLSETNKNSPFIYPVFEENGIDSIVRKPEEEFTIMVKGTVFAEADKIIANDTTISNLKDFLRDYPSFDYYFWNVTFPNIFLGFISDEYCNRAVDFLNCFKDDEEIFEKGVVSFINHNYYFQDSFLKSFFIISNNEKIPQNLQDGIKFEFILQNSLKKSIQRLTVQQLNILENFIDAHPEKARTAFLEKIIIRSIKLWKYSPLQFPFQIEGNKGGQFDLINYLNEQFITGEEPEEKLKSFLDPVFEAIKSKITINEIQIKRIVIDDSHKYVVTFLDFLIFIKITKNDRFNYKIGPLLDNFNDSYLLKKAFYCMAMDRNYACDKDIDEKREVKMPNFDVSYTNRWNDYIKECNKYNKNPLEIFYNEEELQELLEKDQEYANTAIAYSYYKWLKYSKGKELLKEESRALIPLKAILESQSSFIEIYSTYYASTHPIPHENFLENLKKLFHKIMKEIMLKYIKVKFKQDKSYYFTIKKNIGKIRDEKKKQKISKYKKKIEDFKIKRQNDLEQICDKYSGKIDDEFSNKFDYYFNDKKSADHLFYLAVDMLSEVLAKLDPIAKLSTTSYKKSFVKYVKFMGILARSFLIASYSDVKINVNKASYDINIAKYDSIDKGLFLPYVGSGIFSYIGDFVDCLENDDFKDTNKISVGKVFAAVPTIKKFLGQFVSCQLDQDILTYYSVANRGELAMKILGYTFKFHSNNDDDDDKEKIVSKKTIDFVNFLDTSSNELDKIGDNFLFFVNLKDDFGFIKKLCLESSNSAVCSE